MAGRADYEVVDRTPNKTVVDQGLALLLPSFARAVARVMEKNFGDRWWAEVQGMKARGSGPADGKVLRFLDDPPSDSFEDRVGVLQITHCCEIVFAHRKEFTNEWGREHIGASNLILDARHKTSHRSAAVTDLSPEDAEYYLYAMVKMARIIKADQGTVDILDRVHDVVWRGGTLGYIPVRYECQGEEPSVSDVSAPEGRGALAASGAGGRWYDSDGLRQRVLAEMDAMDPDLVEREICDRIVAEVDSMEVRVGSMICVFPTPPGEVPDRPELTIVVLPPADGTVTGESCRAVEAQADEAMAASNGHPRAYRNMLVFLFPETVPYRLLERSASEYLALRRISRAGVDAPGLSRHLREADLDVGRRLRAAYSGVLVPEGMWERYGHCYRRVRSADGNIFDGALESLVHEGLLYLRGNSVPRPFRPTMTALKWPGALPGGSMRISDYWESVSSDCGRPRFESKDVFLQAVWRDVRDGRYGYAAPGPDGGPSDDVRLGEELVSIDMDGFVVNCRNASNGWILLEGGGREIYRPAPRPNREGGGPGERGSAGSRRHERRAAVPEQGRRARGVGRDRGPHGRGDALGPAGVRGPRGRQVRITRAGSAEDREGLLRRGVREDPDGVLRKVLGQDRRGPGEHRQGRRRQRGEAREGAVQARRVRKARHSREGCSVLPGDHGPLLRVRGPGRGRGRAHQVGRQGPEGGPGAGRQGGAAPCPAGAGGRGGAQALLVRVGPPEGRRLGGGRLNRPVRGGGGDRPSPPGGGVPEPLGRQGTGRQRPGGGAGRRRDDFGARPVGRVALRGEGGHIRARHGPRRCHHG